MKRQTITTFAGAQRTRVRHYGDGTAHRLLTPEVVRGLTPLALVVVTMAVLVGGVAVLPAHPLALVALWVGVMGLLIALPLAAIHAAVAILPAVER